MYAVSKFASEFVFTELADSCFDHEDITTTIWVDVNALDLWYMHVMHYTWRAFAHL